MTSNYKTRLCKNFTLQGSCPYGDQCLFAHGEHELRPWPPPGLAPLASTPAPAPVALPLASTMPRALATAPASSAFAKTKLCNYWLQGPCPYGNSCKFAHGEHELQPGAVQQVLVQQIAGPPPPPPLPPPPPPVQAPPRPPPSQEQPSRAQLDAAVKDVLDAVKEARDTAFTGPRLRANLTRKALLAADLRVLLTGHDIGVDVEDVDEAVVMAATQLHDAELLQALVAALWREGEHPDWSEATMHGRISRQQLQQAPPRDPTDIPALGDAGPGLWNLEDGTVKEVPLLHNVMDGLPPGLRASNDAIAAVLRVITKCRPCSVLDRQAGQDRRWMAGGTVFHIPFQTAIHSRPTAAVLALLAPLKALKEHGAALKQDADAYRQHRMLMDLCRRERDTEDQHGSSFQPTCVWEQCLEALTASEAAATRKRPQRLNAAVAKWQAEEAALMQARWQRQQEEQQRLRREAEQREAEQRRVAQQREAEQRRGAEQREAEQIRDAQRRAREQALERQHQHLASLATAATLKAQQPAAAAASSSGLRGGFFNKAAAAAAALLQPKPQPQAPPQPKLMPQQQRAQQLAQQLLVRLQGLPALAAAGNADAIRELADEELADEELADEELAEGAC